MKKFYLNLTIFLAIVFSLISSSAWAATFIIRNDGGSAAQCDGTHDAAQSGAVDSGDAGSLPDCAWRSLATALPRTGALISGGDTVIIDNVDRNVGSGQAKYQIGYSGTDIVHDGDCYPEAAYACTMAAIPPGIPGNETKIYGKGYATCSSMTVNQKAQLWGEQRISTILTGSNYVDIECLDITDHRSCIQAGPNEDGIQCNRDCTGGACVGADTGLDLSNATGVILKDDDIHGLYRGMMVYRAGDINMIRTNIVANSFVGIDSDAAGDDSLVGTVTLDNSKVIFSGCGEQSPLTTTNFVTTTDKHHCYSQDQGGFGDGIGLGDGNPGNWIFKNGSEISWNVSDGVDLLHGNGTGEIDFLQSKAEGNAGQAFKSSVALTNIENSKLIGNCGFFKGRSFTATKNVSADTTEFNNCRANGDTVAFYVFGPGKEIHIKNSTVLSNGNVAFLSKGVSCDATDKYTIDNSIVLGGREFGDDHGFNNAGGNDTTDLYYAGGSDGDGTGSCGSLAVDIKHSIVFGTKSIGSDTDCFGGTGNQCNVDPLFSGTIKQGPASGDGVATDYYQGLDYGNQLGLQSGSTARNNADETVNCDGDCSIDFNSFDRGASWDIGALEFNSADTDPCGNGSIDSGESCDGANLNSKTCGTQGFDGGSLSCNADCSFNTSACTLNCGNGTIQSPEQCDGANLNSQTCVTQGFNSGTLTCNANCTFSNSACVNEACGNEIVEGAEDCDTSDLSSHTCITEGFEAGTLGCSASCTFDTSGCILVACGNGTVGPGEDCDGSNLNGKSCVTQGFDSGTLSCSSCVFNTSGCSNNAPSTNDKMIIGGRINGGGAVNIQ